MSRGQDLTPQEKAQISSLFFEYTASHEGSSKTSIVKMVAKATGRAESSIWKILREHAELRESSGSELLDFSSTCKKRSGRPSGLTESIKKKIKKENGRSGGTSIRILSEKLKIKKSTLHQWLHKISSEK